MEKKIPYFEGRKYGKQFPQESGKKWKLEEWGNKENIFKRNKIKEKESRHSWIQEHTEKGERKRKPHICGFLTCYQTCSCGYLSYFLLFIMDSLVVLTGS